MKSTQSVLTLLVAVLASLMVTTYIGAEVHNLTKWVVDNIAPDGTSIGGYITRVMEQHYADNWNTDKNLYDAGDTGEGYTTEELFDAVSVVMGVEERKETERKRVKYLATLTVQRCSSRCAVDMTSSQYVSTLLFRSIEVKTSTDNNKEESPCQF